MLLLSNTQEISIVSYNVQGLPGIIVPYYGKDRYEKIHRYFEKNHFDIILLQETWTKISKTVIPKNLIIKHLDKADKEGRWYGSGLSMGVYKKSIFYGYRHFTKCTGIDCLASKGFQVINIEIADDKYLAVYNVHLQAHGCRACKKVREDQIIELAEFINNYNKKDAVIVGGDFNFNCTKRKDQFNLFVELTGLKIGKTTNNIYDHIFFKSGEDVKLKEIEYSYNYKDLEKLSDHKPIYKKFKVIF